MEQLGLSDFANSDSLYHELHSAFTNRLAELGSVIEGITLNETKSYVALKARSDLAVKFAEKTNRKREMRIDVEFRIIYAELFPHKSIKPIEDKKCRITYANRADFLVDIDIFLEIAVKRLMALAGEGFGCCSRYVACSDAKACVHPEYLVSLACQYRNNLKSGRIFYGKNRNIDN